EPGAVRQVGSLETARTLSRMLVQVVEHGTGHLAAVPGYDVGGKTGTAQKLDPATRRYSRAPGVLSFIGFVPADEPRLVLLVLLDEPKNEKWGSEAAAPIFAAIAGPVLRYLEVPPRDAVPIQIVTGPGAEVAPRVQLVSTATVPAAGGLMPDVRGRTLRQALGTLAPLGVGVRVEGRGRVTQLSPAPGERVNEDAVARLTLTPVGRGAALVVTEGDPLRDVRVAQVLVPSARRALAALAGAYWDHPSRALMLVGITGTNGKTTTSYLVDALLRARGGATGILGTIQYVVGGEIRPAGQTTPEALEIEAMLATMRERAVRG